MAEEKRRQAVDTIARHMIVRAWKDGEIPDDPTGIDDDTMWEVTERGAEIAKSIDVSQEQYEAAVANLAEHQLAHAGGGA